MSQHLVHSKTKLDEVEAGSVVSRQSTLDKVMESDKFEQIVEAILAGKYSWACVLILRFAGYNPLHYIPYRTYNRLMKSNSQKITLNQLQKHSLNKEQKSLAVKSSKASFNQPSYKVNDLSYLEVVPRQDKQVHGGNRVYLPKDWNWLESDFGFFGEKLASTAEV